MKIRHKFTAAALALLLLLPSVHMTWADTEDVIIFDDLESYDDGYVPNGIKGWGSNADKPVKVKDLNGNKVIAYTGTGNFGQFMYEEYTGKLWASVDVLLPEKFTDFRLQCTNPYGGIPIAYIYIYENGTIKAENYRENGSKQYITLCTDAPVHSGWMRLRFYLDTDAQTMRLYLGDKPQGDAVDFYYKNFKKAVGNYTAEQASAPILKRLQFGTSAAGASDSFYLDNFEISYARAVTTPDPILDIVDVGEEYTFRETVECSVDDGTVRSFPVTWEAAGTPLDVNVLGDYGYVGTSDFINDTVSLTVSVRERTIVSIEDTYETTYQLSNYKMPKTVKALMSDGNYKDVPVTWDSSISTDTLGMKSAEGTVEGFGRVKLFVMVTVYEILYVDNVYDGAALGETYEFPKSVTAKVSGNEKRQVGVEWKEPVLDTSKKGRYTFTGYVEGYAKNITLTVTVYEEAEDDELILDTLLEYYENCLTEGRDVTRYGRSAEEGVLFASGINRATGEHAVWQFENEDIPTTDLASETALVRGLVGMSELTGDEKYEQAVRDAYQYYFDHYVDEKNSMLKWGGHMAVDMRDYSVIEDVSVHELKDHYPYFEMMYEIDPERTRNYIRGIWAGHIHNFQTLEFSRHFSMNNSMSKEMLAKVWDQEFNYPDPYFEATEGLLTFMIAANDYIYSAGLLSELDGDTDALKWAVRLEDMYNKGRNPETGLVPNLFTRTGKGREEIHDVWDPEYTYSGYGDRAHLNLIDLKVKDDFYFQDACFVYAYSNDLSSFCYNPMTCFRIAKHADEETARYLIDESIKTLEGFIRYKYDFSTGKIKPYVIDGTDLTGYVLKKTGYYGDYGTILEPWEMEADYLLAFAQGYSYSQSEIIWSALRNLYSYYGVGDVGTAPGKEMELNLMTDCAEPYVLMGLCEMYETYNCEEYLDLARIVANNIVSQRFIEGYFYEDDKRLYANLNASEPYALVRFLATVKGIGKNIPEYFGSRGLYSFDWYDRSTQTHTKIMSNKMWSLTLAGEILAESIDVAETEITLRVGEKYIFDAMVEPETTEDKTVEWESSDRNVCTIDSDGVLTALAQGEVVVTATAVSGGCSDTVRIRVEE